MKLSRVENKLIVISEPVGVAAYDFDFDLNFACTHPCVIESEEPCVLRVGALDDYAAAYEDKLAMGLRLVNTPAEHARASELEHWYPLIEDLTPRTVVFDTLPSAESIEAHFDWPVFLKGSRQTSKHSAALSVARSRSQYLEVAEAWRRDPILHWQKPVVREFVPLMPVAGGVPGKLQASVEYRSFWWHGECVGWGRYWYAVPPYECADAEAGLALAHEVARRLQVPFLVVDVAKTLDGHWTVIECNDAQESGHAAIAPLLLWRDVLARIAG